MADPLHKAVIKLEQKEKLRSRVGHARVAKPAYVDWLTQGGVRSTAPMPKPVRSYLKRYGPGALEDLAP